ncbi:MAG: ribosome-recycling factor, partial [Candidatus Moeniiplasma glomeromycotorum]|nr:ribosome-recycling factor [Candidatus Moeniiplasma glomeromycotorum]
KQKKNELFQKELEFFTEKIAQVHVNRLDLGAIGEKIKLDWRGKKVPLRSLAHLNISPSHELVVSNYESKMTSLIKNAILNNSLGYEFEMMDEKNNSNQLYFTLSVMTKEKRDRFIQQVEEIAKKGLVALRQVRENFRNLVKKEKNFSQDQKRNYEGQIDKLTKDYENKLMEVEKKKIKNLNS